jgi:hypothetical protein
VRRAHRGMQHNTMHAALPFKQLWMVTPEAKRGKPTAACFIMGIGCLQLQAVMQQLKVLLGSRSWCSSLPKLLARSSWSWGEGMQTDQLLDAAPGVQPTIGRAHLKVKTLLTTSRERKTSEGGSR